MISSVVFCIDIDTDGTSKFATTTVKPNSNGVVKNQKLNIEGRVWSVVDFNSPAKPDVNTETIANTPEKRKFAVVDFNDNIEPDTSVTAIPLVRNQMGKDSKQTVSTFKPETPQVKKTKVLNDKEWREWAEKQLKMYKDKNSLQNK